MVTEFAEIVVRWNPFYSLVATAAFTLIGLLFIAISINIDVIARLDEKGDIRMIAYQIFINFLVVFAFGVIFLIPNQTPFWIGMPLLALGILALAGIIGILLQLKQSQRFVPQSDLGFFLIPNLICYLFLVWIAFGILDENTNRFNWMILVVIYLISAAAKGSWDLMMGIAKMKQIERA